MEPLTELARSESARGEVVLRRRGTGTGEVTELVVNGVFAMDTTETSSERALAALVPTVGGRALAVLVGGLGLGFTARAVLERRDLGAVRLDVVELEECLVSWANARISPELAAVAHDPRVCLHVGDVAEVLRGSSPPAGPWDAILLDVDNGPDFLIHDHNADLYGSELLAAAAERLTPGGVLAIWCQGPATDLLATLAALGTAAEHRYEVPREGRVFSYAIYTLTPTFDGVAARH